MTILLYTIAALALLLSYMKDRGKTKKALKKAYMSLSKILPQFLTVILVIGLMLTLLSPEIISHFIGSQSGALGVLLAALIGSITLLPGFIAFPLTSALLENGAGVAQLGAFASSLMMVGVVTASLESSVFLKKTMLIRNISAFVYSLLVAGVMGVLLS